MKSVAFSAILAAGSLVEGYVLQPRTNKVDWRLEQKRQIVGIATSLLGKGGKVSAPVGAAPVRVIQQSTSKLSGAKRIKMRYGPYMVPGMNGTSITGETGMLWNYPDTSIQKPGTEYTIVNQWAGLEYPDGANANIDTGMWLHHMVHFVSGSGRWDPTCYGKRSLPHFNVNVSPGNSERYFSSGNERSHITLDIFGTATKAGYHIKSSDRYQFIVDLMNMNVPNKVVYMTMTYDIIDGPLPSGWKNVKTVWFDARQCGTSEVQPPRQSGSFTVTSGTWVPNFEGDVLAVGGHVHDGGVNIQTRYRGNTVACTAKAAYGETKEYENAHTMAAPAPGGSSGGHGHGVAPHHISSMTICVNGYQGQSMGVKALSRDQSWSVAANYDYDKFNGNKNSRGRQDEIMAIALMYVAIAPGGVTPSGGGLSLGSIGGTGGGKGGRRQQSRYDAAGNLMTIADSEFDITEPTFSFETAETNDTVEATQ